MLRGTDGICWSRATRSFVPCLVCLELLVDICACRMLDLRPVPWVGGLNKVATLRLLFSLLQLLFVDLLACVLVDGYLKKNTLKRKM